MSLHASDAPSYTALDLGTAWGPAARPWGCAGLSLQGMQLTVWYLEASFPLAGKEPSPGKGQSQISAFRLTLLHKFRACKSTKCLLLQVCIPKCKEGAGRKCLLAKR